MSANPCDNLFETSVVSKYIAEFEEHVRDFEKLSSLILESVGVALSVLRRLNAREKRDESKQMLQGEFDLDFLELGFGDGLCTRVLVEDGVLNGLALDREGVVTLADDGGDNETFPLAKLHSKVVTQKLLKSNENALKEFPLHLNTELKNIDRIKAIICIRACQLIPWTFLFGNHFDAQFVFIKNCGCLLDFNGNRCKTNSRAKFHTYLLEIAATTRYELIEGTQDNDLLVFESSTATERSEKAKQKIYKKCCHKFNIKQ